MNSLTEGDLRKSASKLKSSSIDLFLQKVTVENG